MRPGSLFLNNRYHDPQLGTFISVDPLVAATGEPYIYASGNPTTLSDPSGLEPGCGATRVSSGSCEASHTGNACAGTSYYACGTHDGGPNRGQRYVKGYGSRAIAEFGAGIGVVRSCVRRCTDLTLSEVYEKVGVYGPGALNDAAGAAVDQVTFTIRSSGGNGLTGRYRVEQFHYRKGLDDARSVFGKAENLVVGTRWVGRAFVVYDLSTAFDEWGASEGHSTWYRVGYTATMTTVKVGGTVAGAAGGAAIGLWAGSFAGPGYGTAIGGAVGAAAGGLVGWIATDKVVDYVYEFVYERV